MADRSAIEWTDATWNPMRGCRRVSEGCRNCYAERQAIRHAGPGGHYEGLVRSTSTGPRWTGASRFLPELLEQPLRWRRPRRVFVDSMSDLFFEGHAFEDIAAVFGYMAAASWHTFQVLTKRPERALEWFRWVQAQDRGLDSTSGLLHCCAAALAVETQHGSASEPLHTKFCADPDGPWPVRNVDIGVSVEDQATADERIPLLLQLPAARRFVSYEPALGPVDFGDSLGLEWERCGACGVRYPDIYWGDDDQWCRAVGGNADGTAGGLRCPTCFRAAVRALGEEPRLEVLAPPLKRIDWIIVGGESGPGARPFDLAWARSTVKQCADAGVACFVKQLGARTRALAAQAGLTMRELAARCSSSRQSVATKLTALVQSGEVVHDGVRRGRRYSLAAAARAA